MPCFWRENISRFLRPPRNRPEQASGIYQLFDNFASLTTVLLSFKCTARLVEYCLLGLIYIHSYCSSIYDRSQCNLPQGSRQANSCGEKFCQDSNSQASLCAVTCANLYEEDVLYPNHYSMQVCHQSLLCDIERPCFVYSADETSRFNFDMNSNRGTLQPIAYNSAAFCNAQSVINSFACATSSSSKSSDDPFWQNLNEATAECQSERPTGFELSFTDEEAEVKKKKTIS